MVGSLPLDNTLDMNSKFTAYCLLLLVIVGFGCKERPTQEEKTIPRNGFVHSKDSIDLYYRFLGSGKDTLVLIHGGPGMDSEYFIADFEPLAKNHVLLFYDQRGGGQSTLPDTLNAQKLLGIDKHVEDLEVLRKRFRFKKLKVIAHSFGPMILAKYAIRHPDKIENMVLIGPVPPMHWKFFPDIKWPESPLTEMEKQEMDSLWNEIKDNVNPKENCIRFWNIALKPRLAKGIPIETVKGDCCAASPKAIWYGYKYTNEITFNSLGEWDFRDSLSNLNIPTLIIHGVEESIPMESAEAWDSVLPKSELIKISKAGHFPYVENPDEVWPKIEEFLAQKDSVH